jgi:C4-dicarboxylate transporter, DctM subunit
MEPVTIGLLGIVALMVLIFLGVHVCGALVIVGLGGLVILTDANVGLINISVIPFNAVNSYNFAVLPLFMFMGELVSQGGLATKAFETVKAWIGQLNGGLAMATTLALAGYLRPYVGQAPLLQWL